MDIAGSVPPFVTRCLAFLVVLAWLAGSIVALAPARAADSAVLSLQVSTSQPSLAPG